MPLAPSLAGRTFPATEPYTVSREKVREFVTATGGTYAEGAVPATFPIVVAFAAMSDLMADPDVGISLHRVVHGEQRFTYSRPVREGDRLAAELTVDSVRSLGGTDLVSTRSEVTDADGGHVCTAYATLVHSAPESEA